MKLRGGSERVKYGGWGSACSSSALPSNLSQLYEYVNMKYSPDIMVVTAGI